jgi:hypothetical protein
MARDFTGERSWSVSCKARLQHATASTTVVPGGKAHLHCVDAGALAGTGARTGTTVGLGARKLLRSGTALRTYRRCHARTDRPDRDGL